MPYLLSLIGLGILYLVTRVKGQPPVPTSALTPPPPTPTVPPTTVLRATVPKFGSVAPTRVAPYVTAPEDIGDPVSWGPVGSDGTQVATLFRDKRTGGYAHVSYHGALAAAQALGATLPTREDLIALSDQARAAGNELVPVTLPGASLELMAEGARPGDPAMVTERWARVHDAAVQKQLEALRAAGKWDGRQPVANAGKVWVAGAPPGRAYLMGWRRRDGTWIQEGTATGAGSHNDQHCDYAMLLTLKRPTNAAVA